MQQWAGTGETEVRERDDKIRRAVGYMKRDQPIAAFYGVPVELVASIRKEAAPKVQPRVRAHLKSFKQAGIYGIGADMGADFRQSTANSSALLHRRIWSLYERAAQERGLPDPLVAAVQFGMSA